MCSFTPTNIKALMEVDLEEPETRWFTLYGEIDILFGLSMLQFFFLGGDLDPNCLPTAPLCYLELPSQRYYILHPQKSKSQILFVCLERSPTFLEVLDFNSDLEFLLHPDPIILQFNTCSAEANREAPALDRSTAGAWKSFRLGSMMGISSGEPKAWDFSRNTEQALRCNIVKGLPWVLSSQDWFQICLSDRFTLNYTCHWLVKKA